MANPKHSEAWITTSKAVNSVKFGVIPASGDFDALERDEGKNSRPNFTVVGPSALKIDESPSPAWENDEIKLIESKLHN